MNIRATDTAGGVGGSPIASALADPHRRRGTVALLERYLLTTAPIHNPKTWAPIIKAMVAAARDCEDPRGAARCAGVLAALRAQDIQIAVLIDKAERLDDGSPTENVGVRTFVLREFDRRG